MPETPTPRLGLYRPKSDGSENVNVLTDLNNNFDRIDSYMGFQVQPTQAARFAMTNAYVGMTVRQADTGVLYVLAALPASTAGNWVQVATGAGNGITVVANQAGRDAQVGTNGAAVWRTDRKWMEIHDGTAWRVQGVPVVSSVADLAAITNPAPGAVAWNTNDIKLYAYTSGAWRPQAPGYVTHTTRTANSAGATTTEVIVDTVTFTAAANRRYKASWKGGISSSAAGDNMEAHMRWAAGATVTNTSTLIDGLIITGSATNGVYPSSLFDPSLLPGAGQVTVGVGIARSFGSGTITSTAAGNYPTKLLIEDVGN